MRRRDSSQVNTDSKARDELAGAIREVGIALRLAGSLVALADWECATPTEDYARQLLAQGEDSTGDWVGTILSHRGGYDAASWVNIRKHIKRFRNAILHFLDPDRKKQLRALLTQKTADYVPGTELGRIITELNNDPDAASDESDDVVAVPSPWDTGRRK